MLQPLRVVDAGPKTTDGKASVEIYRPFFLAGILTMLTAGCTLGAAALVGICSRASYTSTPMTPFVLAHANSQLYGWVGFFIIGFALQQHAPRVSRVRLYHRLAYASMATMAAGIALRFVAEPLAQQSATWRTLGTLSAVLQLVAVLLFVTNTSVTRYRAGGRLEWQTKFVFASLAWMVLVAGAEPFYFAASHGPNAIEVMACWSPILRNAQFLGFVANMIFGVALVKLGSCFGFREAHRSYGDAAFYLWNGGLIACIWWPFAGVTVLGAATVLLLASSRVYEPVTQTSPAQKFVRSSYTWLWLSMALLLLEPLHLRLTGQTMSHAYVGAVRHGITVGFISQMILGFGLHVASRMNDIVEVPHLWTAFLLVNLGNLGRVSLEIATDYTPRAFGIMGPTGFIELAGLAIWAYAVVAMMLKGLRARNARLRLVKQPTFGG